MDHGTKMMIRQLTEDIKKLYRIEAPIQNMDDVVKRLGGALHRCNKIYFESSVIKNGDGFDVIISAFSEHRRKNFAVALELGHLFLHMGYKTNKRIWDSYPDHTAYSSDDVEKEWQAIEFADAFLEKES